MNHCTARFNLKFQSGSFNQFLISLVVWVIPLGIVVVPPLLPRPIRFANCRMRIMQRLSIAFVSVLLPQASRPHTSSSRQHTLAALLVTARTQLQAVCNSRGLHVTSLTRKKNPNRKKKSLEEACGDGVGARLGRPGEVLARVVIAFSHPN